MALREIATVCLVDRFMSAANHLGGSADEEGEEAEGDAVGEDFICERMRRNKSSRLPWKPRTAAAFPPPISLVSRQIIPWANVPFFALDVQRLRAVMPVRGGPSSMRIPRKVRLSPH